MTKKEIKFLEDIAAFIKYVTKVEKDRPRSFFLALSTIGHDVQGLFDYKEDKLFLPRTSGYSEKAKAK